VTSRCVPARMLMASPPIVWISAYLLLYLALDIATVAVLDAPGSVAVVAPGSVAVDIAWSLPLHLGALMLAALALMLLRTAADQSWRRFRLAAVGVFVLPAAALSLLLTGGDATALLAVLPMHLLMGLLILQPRA
jgi:hypothetical protein